MGISNMPDIIESFEKLGLSSNEAKVYLALLENHPITGYQLSKESGILRPVVYEMLNRLVEKGGARIIKSNPDTYIPVEIQEFLKNIEADFTDAKKNISKTLNDFIVVDNTDFFWNIIGKKNIINSVITLLERAQSEITISIQKQEHLDEFIRFLEECVKSNIKIDIFSYHAIDTRGLTLYTYQLDPQFKSPEVKEDSIYITADGIEGMVINMTDDKTSKAVYSKNESLVKLIKQQIWNNIYIIRLWKYLGTEKLKIIMSTEDKKLMESIEKYLESGR